jgi:hypothetical protein
VTDPTDFPRRSYPLVVAPPGGFEDAVKRGRSMRRRRASGTSGIALVLVGAIGYAVLNPGTGGVDRLEPTTEDRREQTAPAVDGPVVQSPAPSVAPTSTPRPGAIGSAAPGVVTSQRPNVTPTSVVLNTRPPGGGSGGRHYAARGEITRDEATTNTDTGCIASAEEWCVRANVDTTNAKEGVYVLEYHVCRSVNAGNKTVRFPRKPYVEFVTKDVSNNDVVWTYSLGVKKTNQADEFEFQSGTCVRWHVQWNGLDDFNYNPPQGTYQLTARGLATEPLPQAQATFTHE